MKNIESMEGYDISKLSNDKIEMAQPGIKST